MERLDRYAARILWGISMTVPFSESDKKLIVPTFPLPNVILYPNALLPLHIFEPRYLQLVQDCLESSKKLVLALLKPGWEQDYFGRPPVFPIAGLGEIVHWDRLPSGKFNVLVRGLARVRIEEEFGGGPYRIAQVEKLEEAASSVNDFCAERNRLIHGLKQLNEESVNLPQSVQIGHLADLVTIALPIEVYRKQEIFETVDLRRRIGSVLDSIEEVLTRKNQLRRVESFMPSDVSLN